MHWEVDSCVDSWIHALEVERPGPFGRFIYLWIAFNQLYNYHCYDLNHTCGLNKQLAFDLMPRESGSTDCKQGLSCGYGKKGHETVTGWGRVACVVRSLPEHVSANILHRQEVDFFLTREVYNPIGQNWLPKHGGVLNIHQTKIKSP